ncbi:MAG: hypothetical protein AAFO91_14485 [Bacteroidota bacterium]
MTGHEAILADGIVGRWDLVAGVDVDAAADAGEGVALLVLEQTTRLVATRKLRPVHRSNGIGQHQGDLDVATLAFG